MSRFDPRTDPTARTNTRAFWEGYGAFREGQWYDRRKHDPDWMAGWCFGMTEGRRWKPWWRSKTLWMSVASAVLAGLAVIEPSVYGNHLSRGAAAIVFGVSVLSGFLRHLTQTSIHKEPFGPVPAQY